MLEGGRFGDDGENLAVGVTRGAVVSGVGGGVLIFHDFFDCQLGQGPGRDA